MKIKTYLVSTLSEAVIQIKKDLGPGAVILSTRKADGGLGKKWWKPNRARLEVTAAIDMEEGQNARPDANQTSLNQVLKIVNQMTEDKLGTLRKELSSLKESVEQNPPSRNDPVPPFYAEKNSEPEPRRYTAEPEIPEAALPPAQTAPAPEPVIEAPRVESAPAIAQQIVSAPSNVYPFVAPTYQTYADQFRHLKNGGAGIIATLRKLQSQGVETSLLQTLAGDLKALKTDLSEDQTDELAAQWLLERLPAVQPYRPGRDPRLIALVGPTGSGKTTTLAKLASQLSLEHGKSLGFITVDHFRIGAVEQLRHYAYILKAPCEVVRDAAGFRYALARMTNLDTILIDTVGRSPNDAEGILGLCRILAGRTDMWKAFVAPATLKDEDLYGAMRSFSELDFNRVILTKLDETTHYGSLYNASVRSEVPLSYFTTGQNVPEDIEEASPERILDCLLHFSGAKQEAAYAQQAQAAAGFEAFLQGGEGL